MPNNVKNTPLRILFVGDIIGKPGRHVLRELLPQLICKYKIDGVIANGENAAGGKGITSQVAYELLEIGVEVITTGNHIWQYQQIEGCLKEEARLLRPANYPSIAPGKGCGLYTTQNGILYSVINLQGRVFMEPINCPFEESRSLIKKIQSKTPIIIVDFHAEATSEKRAMGWYLDGEVSAVIGTHTHIQTADETLLPQGTLYISDVGMTGAERSVIGLQIEKAINRFLTGRRIPFSVAKKETNLQGVILTIDPHTGKGLSIQRIKEYGKK
jgi:hypothetical protein